MATADRVVLLTEASIEIGSGHLVECLRLAEVFPEFNLAPLFWVSDSTSSNLVASLCAGWDVNYWGKASSARSIEDVARALQTESVSAVLTNVRRIEQADIDALANLNVPVICIDELGGRRVEADAIVNNSLASDHHNYLWSMSTIYAGPQYMCMGREYSRANGLSRNFPFGIRNVVVSMGGTNPTRSTLRIVEALAGWKPSAVKHIVAGAGFDFFDSLEQVTTASGDDFTLHCALPSLHPLLMEADLCITAGGNTLFELACLGTPAAVLYESPHERVQAEAFAAAGFGICLGDGSMVCADDISRGLNCLDDPAVLAEQSTRGRSLVDGLGAERIAKIVRECIDSRAKGLAVLN